jgi:hypothetical protein
MGGPDPYGDDGDGAEIAPVYDRSFSGRQALGLARRRSGAGCFCGPRDVALSYDQQPPGAAPPGGIGGVGGPGGEDEQQCCDQVEADLVLLEAQINTYKDQMKGDVELVFRTVKDALD